jgi:hypothetical protein
MSPEDRADYQDRNNAEDQVKQILKDAESARAVQLQAIAEKERQARETRDRLQSYAESSEGMTPNQIANLGWEDEVNEYNQATSALEQFRREREKLAREDPIGKSAQDQITAARQLAELNIEERRQKILEDGIEKQKSKWKKFYDDLKERVEAFQNKVKEAGTRKFEEQQKAEKEAMKERERREEELAREADQVRRENQTPAERAAEELQRLKGLRASGALDEESFRRARRKLERGLEEGGNQTFSAEERREAFAVPEQQDETGKELLDNAEKQLETMGEILKVLGTRTAVLIA